MDHPFTHPDELLFLRRLVADRPHLCPSCHTVLTTETLPRCSHCRETLALRFKPSFTRILYWLAALIPLAMGTGLAVFFSLLLLFSPGFPSRLHVIFFSYLCLPALLACLYYRKPLTRKSRTVQVAFAYLAVMLFLTPLLLFIHRL